MHDPTFDIPEEKPEEIYPACDWCGGSGWTDYGRCLNCDGKGYIKPEPKEIYPECEECHGAGRIYDWDSHTYDEGVECPFCDGKGYIEDDEIPY